MKKLLTFFAALMITLSAATSATAINLPDCLNNGALQGAINACEAQGWKLSNTEYFEINYLVAPEPPYLAGNVQLTFVPDCAPNEICLAIVKLVNAEVWVLNNGQCQYKNIH